ncbi:MAG: hypothetical protein ACJ74O_02700 [Frankiaceae bacterium]
MSAQQEQITPRRLVAWCRPLSTVQAISLADDPWHWLPPAGQPLIDVGAAYVLHVGDELIHVPLERDHGLPPADGASAINRIIDHWPTA